MGGFTRAITRTVSKVFKQEPQQGIELAKQYSDKVGETQKTAANNVKGPTSLEIASQNKRKGRRATRLTSATGGTEEYKLSKKSLLG